MRRGLALLVFVACAAHAQDSRARRDLLEALLPLPPGGGKLIPFGDTAQASGVPMALGVVESDNRVTGWGALICLLGCLFATGVLVALGWFAITAAGWVF